MSPVLALAIAASGLAMLGLHLIDSPPRPIRCLLGRHDYVQDSGYVDQVGGVVHVEGCRRRRCYVERVAYYVPPELWVNQGFRKPPPFIIRPRESGPSSYPEE